MSWTQTDTSFKKLSNKRITTSTGKGLPEEKGASTLELYLPDIKTGLIPGTGFAGYGVSGNLFYYGPTAAFGQTLAVDTSVPGNLTWFATSGWANTTAANDGTAASEAQRLGDWVSDKYDAFGTVPGAGYEIKVYDRNNNLITKSDNSNWLFDYQTGILVFNNDATSISTLISTSGPFKIVGWRYIGPKGIIPASYGGLGYTSYNLGDLIVGAGSTIITLPVGTNNYILSADSSTPSGLRWVANSGGGGGSGISYLNNLTDGQQYFATGTSGIGFNISSSGSTHTFNIPIAGVGVTGLITGLAQTIEGSKTFTSAIIGDLVGTATTAGFAFTANYAHQSGYAITSGFATTAYYSYESGYGITSGFSTTASYSYESGYGVTSGFATTASYSYESGYGVTSGFASTANYAYQSGYAITSGFASTSTNINIVNAASGTFYPILSNTFYSTSGIGASVNGLFSFDVASGAFGATSVNIFPGQSYSIGGNSVLSSTSLGTGVTNSSLTALGIITTGTWSATAITAYYGGTGYNSYTKGDILVGAGNTFIKLNVGTDNYVLTASSTSATGLSWLPTAPSAATGLTTLNGLSVGIQYLSFGYSGTVPDFSSSGSTHTLNIPLAGTGSTGLVSTQSQSFAGIKTFTNAVSITDNTVSNSTSTGALTITGGVGIGGSLYTGTSTADSISGVILNNGVITSGSWAGSLITGLYGGTGFNSYNKGDLLVGFGSSFVKLPVGSDNYILAADNTTASGLKWVLNTGGGGGGAGASVYIGENPPPWTSNPGDFWWNSDNGALNIYYADVDTSQWVEINSYFGGVDAPTNMGIGITQINGLGASAQFLYAGFNGSNFNISSTGNSHTFNIPIAGVGITGLVSGFDQTFGGIKTFQNGLISGNGVTIYGSLSLPNQPLSVLYGGTGKTSYNLGDILVGAGTSIIGLSVGTNGYVLQSNSALPSGLGWTNVSSVNVSETAPTPAVTGDLWWNSIDGSLSVYFVDVDSTAQWVEVGNAPSSSTGTSTISGIYYLNGLYDNTQYLNVGAGNSFYVSSSSNTHTINIPLAGSGFTGLMSGIAQTFTGNKTFENDVVVSGMLNFTFATIGTAGITTTPSIAFIGQTNNPITLNILSDNSLSFDSASGQLFKISNDLLADYIYSVNDVSGLPILRAKSDSTLTMAEYGSNVGIGLSNPTYKLQVSGDVYASTSKVAKGFIETVYGFGTTSGTIAPNWNNGSTQTMTLDNNLTLNAPVFMPTGSSMKLIITQDVSGSRLLSQNGAYKFLGGVNTLTTAGNAIDIINIFYDGTNYLSEIKKNYS